MNGFLHVSLQSGGVFSGSSEALWDLTRNDLETRILEPRRSRQTLWVGGTEFGWSDLRVKIFRGPATGDIEDFSALLGPAAYEITGVLREVTDEFVQGPPGNAVFEGGDEARPSTDPTVFLVHGRSVARKEEGARTLESILVKPWKLVVMGEQPNAGRTLLEKFEAAALASTYAVVLLTPDDEGRLAGTDDWEGRARQNVIFELGYFFGLLGRGKVAVLHESGVSQLSDIDGLAHIPLDDSGGWKLLLLRELRAAGVDVDPNRLL